MLLTLSYLATNYFEYIFFYWLFYYFAQIRHATSRESAISSAIIWTAWAIMTPVGGWMSDRLVARFGRQARPASGPHLEPHAAGILLVVAINVTSTGYDGGPSLLDSWSRGGHRWPVLGVVQ